MKRKQIHFTKGKFLKNTRTDFILLIKYTNYFGSPFNTQNNFCCLLNTQTFDIRKFTHRFK